MKTNTTVVRLVCTLLALGQFLAAFICTIVACFSSWGVAVLAGFGGAVAILGCGILSYGAINPNVWEGSNGPI